MKKFKQRKNPNPKITKIVIKLLAQAFYHAERFPLVNALILYNQGMKCKDCGSLYTHCECEYCDECGYRRCLCNYDLFSPDSIRTVVVQIAKKILNKEIIEFRNEVNDLINAYHLSAIRAIELHDVMNEGLK